MDFSLSPELQELQQRVRRFIEDEVIPLELLESEEDGFPTDKLSALHDKAKQAGLIAPQLPVEYGGLGLHALGTCVVFEEAGRSTIGPLALHCAAPDEGNMHLLHLAATPEQKEEYLRPLAAGSFR